MLYDAARLPSFGLQCKITLLKIIGKVLHTAHTCPIPAHCLSYETINLAGRKTKIDQRLKNLL
jgi:hypothetical protein